VLPPTKNTLINPKLTSIIGNFITLFKGQLDCPESLTSSAEFFLLFVIENLLVGG
jgi:hypothetical protein